MNTRRNLIPAVFAALVFIAAAACFVFWDTFKPVAPEDSPGKSGPAPQEELAGPQESAAQDARPGPPPAPPDMEEILRQANSAAGIDGTEAAVRMEKTMAEAGRRVAEDPKAALAWALQQGDRARSALEVVVGAWAAIDPAEAFEALRSLAEQQGPNDRAYGISVLIGHWSTTDPAAAWKAVGTLPDSLDSAMLKSQVVGTWVEKDPTAAAAGLKALTAGGRGKEEQQFLQTSFATVAHRLAVQNGAKAAEWALGFAEGSPERASAVAGVVTGWYGKDAKAVSGWLNGMEDGVVHDTGAAALVTLCMESAPEVSLQWAQAISNEGQRSLLTLNVASRWFSEDPKKAEAWVQNSDLLSAEQRDTILKSFGTVRDLIGAGQGK